MAKKSSVDLAGLVSTKGTAVPLGTVPARSAAPAAATVAGENEGGSMPLNFKVPEKFRRDFKTYAAAHDLKLNQLLYKAFEAYAKANP